MSTASDGHSNKPAALALLSSERPRNLGWFGAAGLLFGDWGTSRLYVLGIAFAVAGRTSFWLILAMNLLILAVAWAYTQICRIYPDGGGVYTAARNRNAFLGVLAALLLFADYTVTASLSALDAFHYFGLEQTESVPNSPATIDAGNDIVHTKEDESSRHKPFWNPTGTAFWAIVSIGVIGAVNLLGPKHSSGWAVLVAAAMIIVTLLVSFCAIPLINWHDLPNQLGTFRGHDYSDMWISFVGIVLALSGVEAIASLTGVMKKPVYKTASKSIWVVAFEVALFNILLTVAMLAIFPLDRYAHKDDMLAYMAGNYLGAWGEWPVRILAGLLLLSAANTAIGALMGLLYVMSRDNEMPQFFQKLNSFGTPWIATIIATIVPILVLMAVNDVTGLSHLYAIGIVGAVAINCVLCAFHPRLRRAYRKSPMMGLGILLGLIWITLAITKLPALMFVLIVLILGFGLRAVSKMAAARRPKPSLLRQAIIHQLGPEALARPRMMLATAGGSQFAEVACEKAARENSTLVVAFVREVSLNYKIEGAAHMTLDNDPAAQALYIDFLEAGHRHNVPIIPAYDTGHNATEILAELAALNGCSKLLIGSSRRGALHQIIKGSFQRKLENLLGADIPVEVLVMK